MRAFHDEARIFTDLYRKYTCGNNFVQPLSDIQALFIFISSWVYMMSLS
ncbi:hypothetical protein CORC01_11267 [Colletotrichum orchidophilum]|uniref:Uncharacterized protein n=1 Tax=Colletotrichum orchidophilum TaxID=1209926 RepID=A0A1G4AWG7_9PEZI|nr:uncharacterized protein CORC01_11267 [Colletotrichum orchidophilum]OHE93402.1 hypothetical protein CORC01_11267 [Colletotrichum orchidophilum]